MSEGQPPNILAVLRALGAPTCRGCQQLVHPAGVRLHEELCSDLKALRAQETAAARAAFLRRYPKCVVHGCTLPPEIVKVERDHDEDIGLSARLKRPMPLCSNHKDAELDERMDGVVRVRAW